MWAPGSRVLLRSVYAGRVRWTFPHTLVEMTSDRVVLYLAPGTPGMRLTRLGFDTCDHVLDVRVDPDGSWHWKDEDELGEAVALGIYTEDDASAIRAEGKRVIASLPALLPTGWETWRPSLAWPLAALPDDWDAV